MRMNRRQLLTGAASVAAPAATAALPIPAPVAPAAPEVAVWGDSLVTWVGTNNGPVSVELFYKHLMEDITRTLGLRYEDLLEKRPPETVLDE